MCAHSSSGIEITEKIGDKLYPFIAKLFQEVVDFDQSQMLKNQDSYLTDNFYQLKSQFESLSNYEIKLVFPSVLSVFNTKDKPDLKPSVDILALQQLTQKKEKLISVLVQAIKTETKEMGMPHEHPLNQLFFVFENLFEYEKKQWHQMLNGWNLGCACFASAQKNSPFIENIK